MTVRYTRSALVALTSASLFAFGSARSAEPAYDLNGPRLSINVMRGAKSLPIGRVPALASGDVVEIRAELPEDQSVRYLLVSTFLRGAANPPPKKWVDSAQTWKSKDKDRVLKLTVPEGARQLVLFMVPRTGGDYGTISDVVRGKPGEFVRATQDLNQASLDRSRLNAFMAGIRAQENSHPEYLRTVAPALSASLAVKLNADCLAKVVESQAACLLENREALVLGDIHSNSLTDTLIGTPADLAFQISATREAGYGLYSPYIGVVRDVARIFGAFNNPEFNYLPAIAVQNGPNVSLLLNKAPSFRKPKSVIVTALPAIEKDVPPPLRASGDGAICAAQPGAVFKVEGAPLIYATDYAHDMALRLTTKDGRTVDAPVLPRASRGGYVLATPLNPADFADSVSARLHGNWGFNTFEGPEFLVQFPQDGDWGQGDAAQRLIVGRDNTLSLKGAAPACVESVSVQWGSGQSQSARWKVEGTDGIAVDVPLTGVPTGNVQVAVKTFGAAKAKLVTVRAYAEASRIDKLLLHAGDDSAVLSGLRLDQIASLTFEGASFAPGDLSRDGNVDKLQMIAAEPDKARLLSEGTAARAQIVLKDGRNVTLPVTVAPRRPSVTLVAKSIDDKTPSSVPLLRLDQTQDLLPDSARLTLSVRAAEGMQFSAADSIEVATVDGSANTILSAANGMQLESPQVAIATFDPAVLGPSAFGPLRFRVIQAGITGNWQPLATLVRLPTIQSVSCDKGAKTCRLTGKNLFLIDSFASGKSFDQSVAVPSGFTGTTIDVPPPQGNRLYLKLRDAPSGIREVVLTGS